MTAAETRAQLAELAVLLVRTGEAASADEATAWIRARLSSRKISGLETKRMRLLAHRPAAAARPRGRRMTFYTDTK